MFKPFDLEDCASLALFAPSAVECPMRVRAIAKQIESLEMVARDRKVPVDRLIKSVFETQPLERLSKRFSRTVATVKSNAVARPVDPVLSALSDFMEREALAQWSPVARREGVESSRNAATLKTSEKEKRAKARIADFARCEVTRELSRLVTDSKGNNKPNWHVLLTGAGLLKSQTAYDATRVDTVKKNHSDSSIAFEGAALKMAEESISDYRPTQVSETRCGVPIPKKAPLAKLYRALQSATLDSAGNVIVSNGSPVIREYARICITESIVLYGQIARGATLLKMRMKHDHLIQPSHDLTKTYAEKEVRGAKKDRKGKSHKATPFAIACDKHVDLATIESEEALRDIQRAGRDHDGHMGSVETGINRETGKSFTRVVLPARIDRTKVETCPKHAARALGKYDHPHAAPTKRRGTLRLQTPD